MVYDLGGGTFDVSILRIEYGWFRVKSTKGDPHLGGDDIDLAIVKWMQETFEKTNHIKLPISEDIRILARLRREAEQAKILLTDQSEYVINLPNILTFEDQSFGLEAVLTQTKLGELAQPLIDRSLKIADEALLRAELRADDLDQILLVGGQSRMLAVKAAIGEHFNCNINDSINPHEAVCRGAAILGARLCGYLKDQVKLWDVIPMSLGIELADGRMDRIIPANHTIPCKSQPRFFTNQRDGQERICFRIFQGERPVAEDNVFIGEVNLNLITSRPANKHRIECAFSVDQDGILHVLAKDANTDSNFVEEKFDHVYRISQQEVDTLLEEARAHKKEDSVIIRLFELKEELDLIQQSGKQKKLVGDSFSKLLQEFESAFDARNADKAEEVLSQIKDL